MQSSYRNTLMADRFKMSLPIDFFIYAENTHSSHIYEKPYLYTEATASLPLSYTVSTST